MATFKNTVKRSVVKCYGSKKALCQVTVLKCTLRRDLQICIMKYHFNIYKGFRPTSTREPFVSSMSITYVFPASSTYLKYATAALSNDEEKILREATDAFTKNNFSGKITATDMCQSEMFSR